MSDRSDPKAHVRRFRAGPSLRDVRLSKAVASGVAGLSVRDAKRLIDFGRVFVEGRRTKTASLRLRGSEQIEVHLDRTEGPEVLGAGHIIWESRLLVAINKPAGLVVYGTHGVTGGTVAPLLERLLRASGRWAPEDRLILVHRLDRDTSGLLLLARTERAATALEGQFRRGRVEKRYLALVDGNPRNDRFVRASDIRAKKPLGHSAGGRADAEGGAGGAARRAETEFLVLERFRRCALVQARPLTGRTHQIRIHLAEIGHPVLGDILYGKEDASYALLRDVPRQMLHAATVRFKDPETGEQRLLEAPLPPDMQEVLARLRRENKINDIK
ncbi:MAG: RluA family pseudouridine synthase [bacterium]